MDELNNIKNTHKVGDTVQLVVTRDGREMTVDVTLAEQP